MQGSHNPTPVIHALLIQHSNAEKNRATTPAVICLPTWAAEELKLTTAADDAQDVVRCDPGCVSSAPVPHRGPQLLCVCVCVVVKARCLNVLGNA